MPTKNKKVCIWTYPYLESAWVDTACGISYDIARALRCFGKAPKLCPNCLNPIITTPRKK